MIDAVTLQRTGRALAGRSGATAVWDLRVDTADGDAAAARHVRHQTLMRAYQARYMLLPSEAPAGSVIDHLNRHYDPEAMAGLEELRRGLEAELIAPLLIPARAAVDDRPFGDWADALVAKLRAAPEVPLTEWLADHPQREAHYRNFLLQSSADLLAEASASALGVIGEFGAPQSALFRILIDEFGYGSHAKKHSVLFRAVMRDFGLPDEYNAGWPLFDTAALELHNTIHFLFQNPRNFFLQIGFLLFAETAYQRSTRDHFRYLSRHHPDVDARYFGEHAHIDLHHTRMVIDEVAQPLVDQYGAEAGREIMVGAEFTRQAFDRAGETLLAIGRAFDAAAEAGRAVYAAPDFTGFGPGVSPQGAARLTAADGPIQIGGLGYVTDAAAFTGFPAGAWGRLSGARV
ncbi:iron-containing redox enzyme family protein [uncultured Brevundimonas sp.]|uniref:iron-containing redox enzyme family protein n=1 Tax=uncultured Brevundimonas sp. TaxID=213418 RepID=UPI0030ECA1A3